MSRKAYDLALLEETFAKVLKKQEHGLLFLKGILSRPLSKDFDDLNTIVTVDELSKLMNDKRADSTSRTRSTSDISFRRGL